MCAITKIRLLIRAMHLTRLLLRAMTKTRLLMRAKPKTRLLMRMFAFWCYAQQLHR